MQETIAGIDKYPAEIYNMKDLRDKRQLESNLEEYQQGWCDYVFHSISFNPNQKPSKLYGHSI